MCNILQTQGARANDRAEGFGQNKDIKELDTIALLPGISTFQTVCFKPLCGLFMQTKYMPLRYCPLEIELELADVTEPIISAPFAPFTAANTSYIWKLENCMMKVDLCTLDNALDNNYTSHLLWGKSLNIVYNTFISNYQRLRNFESLTNIGNTFNRTSFADNRFGGWKDKWFHGYLLIHKQFVV